MQMSDGEEKLHTNIFISYSSDRLFPSSSSAQCHLCESDLFVCEITL